MDDQALDTIFSESFLEKIPVTYRYMTKWETKSVDELYNDARFSESERHQSRAYLNYSPPKPISNIFLTEIYLNNDDER